jgi:signal peptidase II
MVDFRSVRGLELFAAAGVAVVDQITKAIVRSRYDLYETTEVIPGFFNLTRIHNTGAAFGMLNSTDLPMKTTLLGLIAAAALIGLAVYAASLPPDQRVTRLGLALIIGGAAGNLVDRITAGYVVDFVDVYFGSWHFWAFNIADAAITIGVVFMILDLLGAGRRVPGTV